MKKSEHNIVSDGLGGGHNGEYTYHYTKCGKSDWIAHYGTFEQLDFFYEPCVPKPEKKPVEKTIEDILRDNLTTLHNTLDAELIRHNLELKDKHEYIEILEKRHANELAQKNQDIAILKEQIKTLHYTVKGACAEHLSLRVEVNPLMVPHIRGEVDLTRCLTEHANKRMAHAVEKQLGDRYEILKDYDRALRHIHYLENHMQAHCISFTPFGIRQKFQ